MARPFSNVGHLDTQEDPGTDYGLLSTHKCSRESGEDKCGGGFALRSFPVDDGFVVAVCCDRCRDKTGLPSRYSTETPAFLTFDQAETSRKALLRWRS